MKRLQHLHLTYSSERYALTYDLVGTKSYTIVRMAPSPRLSYLVTDRVPPFPRRMAISLISDQHMIEERLYTYIWHIQGTNISTCSKRRALTSHLVGTKSYTLIRMAPSPRLSYLVIDQVPPFSRRMAVALTSVLLNRMASTQISEHERNLIL